MVLLVLNVSKTAINVLTPLFAVSVLGVTRQMRKESAICLFLTVFTCRIQLFVIFVLLATIRLLTLSASLAKL